MQREVIYEAQGQLRVDGPTKVFVKDKAGNILGIYAGYWRPKTETVALYPASGSPLGVGYTPYKHAVSDRVVRIMQN